MIASIIHEFVHLIYRKEVKGIQEVWVEEGLATYLSGQKSFLEQDDNKYKLFIDNIFKKELPDISFLKKQGNNYGEFCDKQTNRYNGYDISYALIRFIIEKYGQDYLVKTIKYSKEFYTLEKKIIEEFKQLYISN